jgi:hypothetical protein
MVRLSHDHDALSTCRKAKYIWSDFERQPLGRAIFSQDVYSCAGILVIFADDNTQQLFAITPHHRSTKSINSAETMKTRSMTAIEDARRSTAAEATTAEATTAEATAHSPLFPVWRAQHIASLSREQTLFV